MDKRYFDNEPGTGCGAMFLLCLTVLAALGGLILG
jgi:hypothetical protein